jgi:LAO/AO transport system kinase
MEIPDIFVLNKADREGIDRLHADVKTMLSLLDPASRGGPPPSILRTVAVRGEGIPELLGAIEEFLGRATPDAVAARRSDRSRERLLSLLRERVMEWAAGPSSGGTFDALVDQVARRALDPHTAADRILESFAPPASR